MNLKKTSIFLILLWLVLCGWTWLSRPLMPVDETRYVAAAWEMHLSKDYLVPHLNGETYSHKPPMMFWLINLGWTIFGVNSLWPRIVPPLFGLASLFLTILISKRLWPDDEQTALLAPFLLLGSILWTVFTTLVMFDMLIAFFALAGILGVLHAYREGGISGWIIAGLSLGLGIISKGPVVFLPVVPAALLAPFWAGKSVYGSWLRWYMGVFFSILLAAAVGLSWALPSAMAGGDEYAEALLWGQTTKRMVNSFAHKQPVWWYLTRLPLVLFPWTIWVAVYRGIFKLDFKDVGIRFCLCWIVPGLIIFSLVSGKQEYYLIALFPGFALLVAKALARIELKRPEIFPFTLITGLIGSAWLVAPFFVGRFGYEDWAGAFNPFFGIVLVIISTGLFVKPIKNIKTAVIIQTVTVIFILMAAHTAFKGTLGPRYEVNELAQIVKQYQDKGIPVANWGKYDGQFHFAGKLEKPVAERHGVHIDEWFEENPNGIGIMYFKKFPPINPFNLKNKKVEKRLFYRTKHAVIVSWDKKDD